MDNKIFKKGGGFLIEETKAEEVFIPEDFSEEQKMFAKTTEEFIEREVLPKSEEIESQNFDVIRSLLKKAGEMGLLSVDIPEKYGGLGLDKVSSMLISEKMSIHGSFSVSWGGHTGIGTLPIVFFGSEDQKKRYLPKLATGEIIGAYALSEPQAGSDAMNIKTKATLSSDGRYYILDGTKQFITNAGFADLFTIFAKIDGEKFSAFLVERNTPGLIIGKEEHKMGIKGSSTCALTLEELKVPVENFLGDVGKGHRIAFNILNIGRYKLGVGALGASKRALSESIRYAKERVQFGKPISEFGLIKEKLSRMVAGIYMGESMAYRLAGLLNEALSSLDSDSPDYPSKVMDGIKEYAVECSILKVYGSEVLDYVVDEAVQVYGGYGYVQEYPVERYYRDSRINRIFEGTNEINRMLITGMLINRAMGGKLPLMGSIDKVSKDFLTFSPASLDIPDEPLGKEKTCLKIGKEILLLVAGVCVKVYKEDLREEEETLAGLSDIITEIYALESGILRAEKMLQRGGSSEDYIDVVRYYTFSFMSKIEYIARKILCGIKSGDELRLLLTGLRKFTRWYIPENMISLQRKIADRAIEREEYPFQ